MASRLRLFDTLRGASVVSMVCFHLCYDIVFIAGRPLPWFEPPLRDIWRASISWTFLVVAGVMSSLSRNNLRRAARYGVVAALVYVVTLQASVDMPISFGIIFCMAASTLLVGVLERCGTVPEGPVAAGVLFGLFLLVLRLPRGVVGLGPAAVAVPLPQSGQGLAWLGLPGPAFASGDYYPLLPFSLLYLAGTACGRHWRKAGFPDACSRWGWEPLEVVGRYALPIYVLHQPLLLALSGAL